jgi:membrane-associated phospholipid phosphatase
MPNDDPEALQRRVRVDYPWKVDRVLGLGMLPTLRLQRALERPRRFRWYEKVLVWAHWIWFFVPHSALLYVLLRRHGRFERSALQVYAVFDLGAVVYWAVPTAPPWYAAREGRIPMGDLPPVRRMMVEYGEEFWGPRWGPLYDFLGGNPVAAMPSIHFATSVMAARVLTDVGPVEGAVGWAYAATLGTALVYLGEHYVIDLIAGFALTQLVRHQGPRFTPLLRGIGHGVQALEARAQG